MKSSDATVNNFEWQLGIAYHNAVILKHMYICNKLSLLLGRSVSFLASYVNNIQKTINVLFACKPLWIPENLNADIRFVFNV